MLVRPMVLEDAEGIFKVRIKTWLDTYPNKEYGVTKEDILFKFSDKDKSLNKIRENIFSHNSNNLGWVVEIDGKIVGFAEVSKKDTKASLNTIYVLPDKQGFGYGKALMGKVLDFCNDSKEIVIFVVGYNHKAIAFYKSFGFRICSGPKRQHLLLKDKGIYVPSETMKKLY